MKTTMSPKQYKVLRLMNVDGEILFSIKFPTQKVLLDKTWIVKTEQGHKVTPTGFDDLIAECNLHKDFSASELFARMKTILYPEGQS